MTLAATIPAGGGHGAVQKPSFRRSPRKDSALPFMPSDAARESLDSPGHQMPVCFGGDQATPANKGKRPYRVW